MSKNGRLDKVERKLEELEAIKKSVEGHGKKLNDGLNSIQHLLSKRQGEFNQVISLVTPLLSSCEQFDEDLKNLSSRQVQLEKLTKQNLEERALERESRLLFKIHELEEKEKTFIGRHWLKLVVVIVSGGCAAALLESQGHTARSFLRLDSVQRLLWGRLP